MISSIILKNIRKKFDSTDFTLQVDALEFTNRNIQTIVGSNGSGKTSLLKLIALLDRPDQGAISFNNDKEILFSDNGSGRLRGKIGFVMQNPYLFNTSVFENVALGLKIRKRPREEVVSRVKGIMEVIRISHLAGQRVKVLSRGEHQKVAIAQILVLEPEIILLDEPSANVDIEGTLSIERIVKDIHGKFNSIIVMTTHSLTQAHRVSSEIITMKEGRIEVIR